MHAHGRSPQITAVSSCRSAREGCPTHPSYGAGHATVAAACVTILKAWFDESFVFPNPVVPDGLGLPERAIRVAK